MISKKKKLNNSRYIEFNMFVSGRQYPDFVLMMRDFFTLSTPIKIWN